MTVTTTDNSISYAGNGTTTAFAFPYIFFVPSDLVVTLIVAATNETVTPPPVLNGLATYDYTVTGDVSDGEYASGGAVTFNTAPPATHTLLMQRAVPPTQTVTLIDNTKFPATTINVEFDKLTILAQQSAYLTTTALQIPSSEAGLVVTAVPVAARANKILLWDATGNLSTIDPAALIGGAVPGGPASGDLAGAYPAPTIKASVGLTGNPTAPTPAAGDNDTSIATTAWVHARGGVIIKEVTLASPAVNIDLFSLAVKSAQIMFRLQTTATASMYLAQAIASVVTGTGVYSSLLQFNSSTTPTPTGSWTPNASAHLIAASIPTGVQVSGDITYSDISSAVGIMQWGFYNGSAYVSSQATLFGPAGHNGFRFLTTSNNFATGSFVRVVGWP